MQSLPLISRLGYAFPPTLPTRGYPRNCSSKLPIRRASGDPPKAPGNRPTLPHVASGARKRGLHRPRRISSTIRGTFSRSPRASAAARASSYSRGGARRLPGNGTSRALRLPLRFPEDGFWPTAGWPTIRELETSAHAKPCFRQLTLNFRIAPHPSTTQSPDACSTTGELCLFLFSIAGATAAPRTPSWLF